MLDQLRQIDTVADLIHTLVQQDDLALYLCGLAWSGALQLDGAFEMLLSALDDPREQVRRMAADALGMLGDARAIAPLLAHLTALTTPSHVHDSLIQALGRLRAESALPALFDRLHTPASSTQFLVAFAIGEIGPRALPTLVSMLQTADEPLKSAVLDALRWLRFHHPQVDGVASVVLPDLAAPDPMVRAQASTLLGRLGDRTATAALLPLLDDAAVHVRTATARALGELKDKTAVARLLAAVHDPSPDVRCAVAAALGALGTRRAVKPLMALLRDTEPRLDQAPIAVAVEAALALGRLGDRRAVPALIDATDAADDDLCWAAVTALGELGAVEARSRLAELAQRSDWGEVSWSDDTVVEAAQEALANLPPA